MTLQGYQYSGNPNIINKSLGTATSLNGNYDLDSTLMHTTVRLTRVDSAAFAMSPFNYLILNPDSNAKDFANRKRCYFVTDYKSLAKGVTLLYLNLDALTTYKDDILSSTANVMRSASEYDLYIKDDMYNALAYPRRGCVVFPGGFDGNYTYLLSVANTLI